MFLGHWCWFFKFRKWLVVFTAVAFLPINKCNTKVTVVLLLLCVRETAGFQQHEERPHKSILPISYITLIKVHQMRCDFYSKTCCSVMTELILMQQFSSIWIFWKGNSGHKAARGLTRPVNCSYQELALKDQWQGNTAREKEKGPVQVTPLFLGVKHSQWNNDEPSAATSTAFMRGWVTVRGAVTDSCEEVGPREGGGRPSIPSMSVRGWPGWWKKRRKKGNISPLGAGKERRCQVKKWGDQQMVARI